jgi:hypothetical protein
VQLKDICIFQVNAEISSIFNMRLANHSPGSIGLISPSYS